MAWAGVAHGEQRWLLCSYLAFYSHSEEQDRIIARRALVLSLLDREIHYFLQGHSRRRPRQQVDRTMARSRPQSPSMRFASFEEGCWCKVK